MAQNCSVQHGGEIFTYVYIYIATVMISAIFSPQPSIKLTIAWTYT